MNINFFPLLANALLSYPITKITSGKYDVYHRRPDDDNIFTSDDEDDLQEHYSCVKKGTI